MYQNDICTYFESTALKRLSHSYPKCYKKNIAKLTYRVTPLGRIGFN